MAEDSYRQIRLGTRGSSLALWQAEHVATMLRNRHPGRSFILESIKTEGDSDRNSPLAEIGSRGVFVSEIEQSLLRGRIQLGVHSLKDLPSQMSPLLVLASVTRREDPRDVLVSRAGLTLARLPVGATVGTSSPRRECQIRAIRPDLNPVSIRGNVETRIRKVMTGRYDAAVLAAAGIHRLGLAGRITEYLPLESFLPAPCQGIIAVETLQADEDSTALARAVDEPSTHTVARAERAFVQALGGGCTTPVAALATMIGRTVRLDGALFGANGASPIRLSVDGDADSPESLGIELARRILSLGGREILAAMQGQNGSRSDE